MSPAFLAAIVTYAALGTTLYLRLLPTVAMPPQLCSAPPLEHTALQPSPYSQSYRQTDRELDTTQCIAGARVTA